MKDNSSQKFDFPAPLGPMRKQGLGTSMGANDRFL